MSFESIHLRKLLKILYLEPARQVSEMRADIRADLAREGGGGGSGGDFHAPFWRDARDHVFGIRDLHDSVEDRVDGNGRRSRLYPVLRDGFLRWWNDRRRWTNEPFRQAPSPHARFRFHDLGTIKIENVLAVRDAAGAEHFVYPYFSETPVLAEEAARLGLWVLSRGLAHLPANELRILDVVRGQTFSLDRNLLVGTEEETLRRRYTALLAQWRALRDEY